MKKISLIIIFLGIFSLITIETSAQHDDNIGVTLQGGYSLINGVIGAELQLSDIGFSFGWLPLTGVDYSSYSVAVSWYLSGFDNGLYASYGIASYGYTTEAMQAFILGWRFWSGPLSLKGGLGYGFGIDSNTAPVVVVGELTLGLTF